MLHRRIIALPVIFTLLAVSTVWGKSPATAPSEKKIAVFGSSVACGGCDDQEKKGGYAGRLATMLAGRGWTVVNVSRGGDNTQTILPRFSAELLPQHPKYVIIGLSLANEGLIGAKTPADRERVQRQFTAGLRHLIDLCRQNGMVPILGQCYAQSLFDAEQYAVTRRTNLETNGWDVPSFNFLGSIDDGTGKWVDGFMQDPGHPNSRGHEEMFRTMVPSLFDALDRKIPQPRKMDTNRFACITGQANTESGFSFTPTDPIHSFTMGFQVRCRGEGTLAGIANGKTWNTIEYRGGKLVYRGGNSSLAASGFSEGKWVDVVISYRRAKDQTSIFINGQPVGTLTGRIEPSSFALGGCGTAKAAPAQADYRNWTVYRSSLNADEAKALHDGQLLQASLEIYAPLQDERFEAGKPARNLAQSLSQVMVRGQIESRTDKR